MKHSAIHTPTKTNTKNN